MESNTIISHNKNKNYFNISSKNNLSMVPKRSKQTVNMSTLVQKETSEQTIEDIMNSIGYNGPVDKFVSYVKNLKQKEDFARYIENNFKNENCPSLKQSFKNAAKFMKEADEKEKEYQNEIAMYQNLCDELLRKNQNKINSDELKDYFNEIYKVKNMIEQYED